MIGNVSHGQKRSPPAPRPSRRAGRGRRRQIDGDPLRRQGETHRGEGGADPLPALADRLVRQPDDGERGQAAAHLYLDVDIEDIDALECGCADARHHLGSPLAWSAGKRRRLADA